MQDEAAARGTWLVWTVTTIDLEHSGKLVARACIAAHRRGTLRPGALVAETLDALRTMLPAGLTRRGPTLALPPEHPVMRQVFQVMGGLLRERIPQPRLPGFVLDSVETLTLVTNERMNWPSAARVLQTKSGLTKTFAFSRAR